MAETAKPSKTEKSRSRAKKEIDKELMYQKLMPSGLRELRDEADDGGNLSGRRGNEPSYVPPPAPVPPYKLTEAHRVAVPSLDNQQTFVINIMESKVISKLDELLERFSCCKCDRCKKDIVALALNKLPPKYMVMASGQPEPESDKQTNAEVVSALIQAAVKVRAHPRH
mgnify:FL=1